ncbi:MAG TPA: Uma2 family endonuclease [Vicinamibacterales bacterium]|nr:Uma2 family endonuclease [Vicinamibacterales bacterium]
MSERLPVYGEVPDDGTILTTSEYLQTAESMRVQELLFGTLCVADSPTFRHQNLLLELALLMRVYVRQHKLGTVCIAPLDVILDPARALILQPDLFYVSNARSHIISDRVWGAPNLIVEVLSPHPRIGKIEDRLRLFGEYGVQECWLMHQPVNEIEVVQFGEFGGASRRLFRSLDRIESNVLPAFGLSPALLSCW